jgi:hypothetical protein
MNPEEIEQGAMRLRELDRQVVEAIVTDTFSRLPELIAEFHALKRRIQSAQIDPTVLPIASEEALPVLRQLREERPFHADRLMEALQARSDEKIPFDELTDAEIDDLGSEYFYSWFSHYEYIRNLYGLGTLIVTASIPERVRAYLAEARQCYAFQQFHAVLALCRAFIEATARDICEQRGLIGADDTAVININERKFNPLISAIAKTPLRKRANSLYYGLASPVVHGARSVSEADAREAIEETLRLVEDLYRENELCGLTSR